MLHISRQGRGGRWTRSRLVVSINDAPAPDRVSFSFLAEHYLKADFGADAVGGSINHTRPVSKKPTLLRNHVLWLRFKFTGKCVNQDSEHSFRAPDRRGAERHLFVRAIQDHLNP